MAMTRTERRELATLARSRRAELRTVVRSRLDHLEKQAKTEIDRTTEAARQFLAEMPAVEDLMPLLDITEIGQLLPAHTRAGSDETIALTDRARRMLGSGDGTA